MERVDPAPEGLLEILDGPLEDLDDAQFEQAVAQVTNSTFSLVPVPKNVGARFSEFFSDAEAVAKLYHDEWKQAYKLFTQTSYMDDRGEEVASSYENVVRTTVETLVDNTYVQNPTTEISTSQEDHNDLAELLNEVLRTLIARRGTKALRMQQHMTKKIVAAHLTNFGVTRLNYTAPSKSRQFAQRIMETIEKKLIDNEDATDEETATLMEQLAVAHEEATIRPNNGISLELLSPFDVFVGPNCETVDFDGTDIVIVREWPKEATLKARYLMRVPDDDGTISDNYVFKYDPSVAYDGGKARPKSADDRSRSAIEQEVLEHIDPQLSEEHSKVARKGRVAVLRVYDRVTRKIYLYLEGNWDTPLWVWNDELNLSQYFPIYILGMSTPVRSVMQKSEVSLYSGFQELLNQTSNTIDFVRTVGASLFLYDKKQIDHNEVERVLTEIKRARSGTLRGIGVDLGSRDTDLSKALEPLKLPVAQFPELLDTTATRAAIDRASRVSAAMRGGEFKTNTTNLAIETYSQNQGTRTEGLVNKVERCAEDIMWGICEIVVSKFTHAEIMELVSADIASTFQNISVEELNRRYRFQIAAGSMEKPTSEKKKQESLQLLQLIGQLGTAAPQMSWRIASRLLRWSFSRALVTDQDLDRLEQEGAVTLAKQAQPAQPTTATPATPTQGMQ